MFDPWRFLPRAGLPIAARCPACRAVHAFPIGWALLAKCGSLVLASAVPLGIVTARFNDSFAAYLLALLATALLFPAAAWIASAACFGLGMTLNVDQRRKA